MQNGVSQEGGAGWGWIEGVVERTSTTCRGASMAGVARTPWAASVAGVNKFKIDVVCGVGHGKG